jgi:hypothetical protein
MRVIKVFKNLNFLISSLLILLFHMSKINLLKDICELIFERLHSINDTVRASAQFAYYLEIAHFISYRLPVNLGELVVCSVKCRAFGGGQVT